MKKLIMATVVAFTAIMSHAAAVDWSAQKVVDPWTSATAGKMTPCNAWVGYAIMASDYTTVMADLAAGKTDSLVASAIGSGAKVSSNKGAFSATGAAGNVAAGSQDFYMIVFNASSIASATHYFVSDKVTETIDGSLDTVINFGAQDTKSSSAAGWTSMAAPEPTSGLMLLLGMGVLALRRRRA